MLKAVSVEGDLKYPCDIFPNSGWHLLAEGLQCAGARPRLLLFKTPSVCGRGCTWQWRRVMPPQKQTARGSVMNHVPWRKNVLNRTWTLQHDNFLSQQPTSIWQALCWLGSPLQNGRRALYLGTCFTAIGQSATAVKIHSIDRPVSSL